MDDDLLLRNGAANLVLIEEIDLGRLGSPSDETLELVGIASALRYRMPCREEHGNRAAADDSGSAGDENPHDCMAKRCSCRRSPQTYNFAGRLDRTRMPLRTLIVNGSKRSVECPPEETLLSVLRNRLSLTGTKYGCGEGQCGACTVLLDGRATRSCRTPVSEAAGSKITTIEGLATGGSLHPAQQAFLDQEAFQCGYCTPGMIVATAALLASRANPTDDEIVESLAGNICRCGTYPRILAAVRQAAGAGKKAARP